MNEQVLKRLTRHYLGYLEWSLGVRFDKAGYQVAHVATKRMVSKGCIHVSNGRTGVLQHGLGAGSIICHRAKEVGDDSTLRSTRWRKRSTSDVTKLSKSRRLTTISITGQGSKKMWKLEWLDETILPGRIWIPTNPPGIQLPTPVVAWCWSHTSELETGAM